MLSFSRARRAAILAGGATAFTPASIAGLVAWYDFSDAATLFTDSARTTAVTADGDAIGGVTDKSGNVAHLASSLTARPLYKTAIQNGKSAALADGINDALQMVSAITPSANTFFMVFKITGTGTLALLGGTDDGGLSVDYSSRNLRLVKTNVSLIGADTTTLSTTAFSIASITYNKTSGAFAFRVNGATGASGTQTATFTNTMNGVFAQRPAATPQLFHNSYGGEFLIYNSVLSAGNIALVESYLNTKWAVY